MPVNNLDALHESRKVDCLKSCRLLVAGDFCFYLHRKCGRTDFSTVRQKCAQLVFLALAIILAQFAALTMKEGSGEQPNSKQS
jgi:hypothetical protein